MSALQGRFPIAFEIKAFAGNYDRNSAVRYSLL
jgi:hypothetical protein